MHTIKEKEDERQAINYYIKKNKRINNNKIKEKNVLSKDDKINYFDNYGKKRLKKGITIKLSVQIISYL